MKKCLYTLLSCFLLVSLNISAQTDTVKVEISKSNSKINYKAAWRKVRRINKDERPKSARKVAYKVLANAEIDNNSVEIVRAILAIEKFNSDFESKADSLNISLLQNKINSVHEPAKSILEEELAEKYKSYYSNNRYKIDNRTTVENPKKNDSDYEFWDAPRFKKEIMKWALISISDKNFLKEIPVRNFSEILDTATESAILRPSLYDLLAHNVLTLFNEDDRPSLYTILDSLPFLNYKDFNSRSIENQPWYSKSSYFIQSLKIYQDLERTNLAENHLDALINVDIARLQFLFSRTEGLKTSNLYQNLKFLQEAFPDQPGSAEIGFQMASIINNGYCPDCKGGSKELKKRALEMCDYYIKEFPKSLGAYNCSVLKQHIVSKHFEPEIEFHQLPNHTIDLKLRYRNTDKVYYKVIALTDKEIKKEDHRNFSDAKLVKIYQSMPVLGKGEFMLPGSGDFGSHVIELAIPGLEFGNYVVLTSDTENFAKSAFVNYQRINITVLKPFLQPDMGKNKARLYVLDANNGDYVRDAQVQIKYNRLPKKALEISKRTNANGYVEIDSFKNYDFNTIWIDIQKDRDHFKLNDIYLYQYRNEERKLKNDTVKSVSFYTDRPIYRPGQKVDYKGIVVRSIHNNLKTDIISGYKTTVYFKDVNRQIIDSQKVTSNEFGSFSGEFKIPVYVLNGTMTISSNLGSVSFSVEEYKRPKFEITFEPVSKVYRLNDSVKLEGNAESFSGFNIDKARVTYTVTAEDAKTKLELKSADSYTDEKGHFSFSFKALPFKTKYRQSDEYVYDISANIIDITGETHSVSTSVKVSEATVSTNIVIPKWINKNEDLVMLPTANNTNGNPVKLKGTITIEKMQEPTQTYWDTIANDADQWLYGKLEYHSKFPYQPFKDENVIQAPEKTYYGIPTISNVSITLSAGLMKDWPQGYYRATYLTRDSFDKEVKSTMLFQVYDPSKSELAFNTLSYYIPVKIKDLKPGEKATMLWGSAIQAYRHVIAEHEGKIVFEKTYEVNHSQVLMEIPILESYRGGLKVVMFSAVDNHSVVSTEEISVPFPSKELEIKTFVFHSTLLPGQKETWKLAIKGPNAEKTSAELMTTLYDASLDEFSKADWNLGFYPQTHNYLDFKEAATEGYKSFNAIVRRTMPEKNYIQHYFDQFDPNLGRWEYVDVDYWGLPINYNKKRRWRSINCPDNFGGNGGGSFRIKRFARVNSDNTSSDNFNVDGYMANQYEGIKSESVSNVSYDKAPPMLKLNGFVTNKVAGEGLGTYSIGYYGGPGESRNYKTANNIESLDLITGGIPAEYGDLSGGIRHIAPRKNLQELAFFYPQLKTNDSGEVEISFTLPEALTKWHFMALAHTKDLMTGVFEKYAVTQKQLMVTPNAPRFLREGDEINFSAKISNMTKDGQDVKVALKLVDPNTEKSLTNMQANAFDSIQVVHLNPMQSQAITWKLKIPKGMEGFIYRVTASNAKFSDGEEGIIPVLPARILITESIPMYVRGGQHKDFKFADIINYPSAPTLAPYRVSMEMTGNPAWYAIKALPYLMEFPHECNEQLWERFFANSIASYIVKKEPKIKETFKAWQKAGGVALASQLEKNPDLKNIQLAETPWVQDALDEKARNKHLADLFDDDKVIKELGDVISKLEHNQLSNGSWSWFQGMEGDEYITTTICMGIGRLEAMGITTEYTYRLRNMASKAFMFLDNSMFKDYMELIKDKEKLSDDHLSSEIVEYLYARSYWKVPVSPVNAIAYRYWLGQSTKYWKDLTLMERAMLVSTLKRTGASTMAQKILTSIDEHALHSDEFGMYWNENTSGYGHDQGEVETQCRLIEAYSSFPKLNPKAVEEMKIWLLKHKQMHNWPTTIATADAIYCLLLKGENLVNGNAVKVSIGGEVFDGSSASQTEVGTGYISHIWQPSEINPKLGEIKIEKNDSGMAWGSVTFQYYQDLDKIKDFGAQMQVKKEAYLQENSEKGPVLKAISDHTNLKAGDLVKIRMEIKLDRDMDYVHLKDLRAGALEPVEAISGYKYHSELSYYQDIKDASMNFFFDHIAKGSYVFEYELRVTQTGEFQNGIATLENMYAPEFNCHSDGVVLKVK